MSDQKPAIDQSPLPELSLDALRRLLAERLDFASLAAPAVEEARAAAGPLADAAVLIPIVKREAGLAVILTRRPETLTRHAGQVSFPGGRIEPSDSGPVAAALREAQEEIGLSPALVEVKGALEPFATGTGFLVYPVVGLVDPAFAARIDPREVAEVFEVPFAFLMDPHNHAKKTGEFRGEKRSYYEMPYAGQRIWGATAHIIVRLYHRLFGPA